jgi:uncharacterized protein (DUF924 family)
MDDALRVREFWFGRLTTSRPAPTEIDRRMELWFGGESPEQQEKQDATIAKQFSHLVERAAKGTLNSWADSPRRRLSLIILLDQFPRNIFRGQARAFAQDQQALELALSGMQSGADGALSTLERMFFYMPLQHSESLEVQEESVAAYRRLVMEAADELRGVCQGALESAQAHRDVIRRFGRFPSRNGALGRETTPDERAYLEGGGARFGQ